MLYMSVIRVWFWFTSRIICAQRESASLQPAKNYRINIRLKLHYEYKYVLSVEYLSYFAV